ncbi:hypothetical protein [Companilactobacillus paralimentarius]|uniref:hypothetical protein n=1 Tax=Companilactobacillus paralimentarius TaxID=83526 RepID=UPI0037E05DA7
MSKTQTLDQAWHLIDFQANLFNWGLGIITFIFGVAVLIQWGLNHKKLSELKNQITNEYDGKITVLETEIESLNTDMKSITDMNDVLNNLKKEQDRLLENIEDLNIKTSYQYQINFMSNPEIAESKKDTLQKSLKKFGYQVDSELHNIFLENDGKNYQDKKMFDIRVSFIGIRRDEKSIKSNIELLINKAIPDALDITVDKYKDGRCKI